MIQNFDKVVKFDLDDTVTYYNIEIHKQCHMNHLFWVKMVKFDKNCIIFTNSKKNQNEITDVLIQNYAL